MKKMKKRLIFLCVCMFLLIGCGKKEDEELLEVSIAESIEVKEEALPEEAFSKVEEGISNWAAAFLAVDSNTEDREITDKILYQCITNLKQREKFKKAREKFYKNSDVEIQDIQTEVLDSNLAKYVEREVGVVNCKIVVNGIKNEKEFEKEYEMKMIVDYQGDIVSVYEIESIKW